MKFKTFLENLVKISKERPESLEMDVVTSADDEGNGFNLISFPPSFGRYDIQGRDFYPEDDDDDGYGVVFYDDDDDEVGEINAICVN